MSKDKQGGGGYGNPPLHSRFKPGQSGNPKGSKNKTTAGHADRLAQLILAEANREVPIKESGEAVKIPVAKAIMRAVIANSLKGVAKSQQLFFDATRYAAKHEDDRRNALLEAAVNYKENCRVVAENCDKADMPCPEFFPDPDHIQIDSATGEVSVIGPMTRDDQAEDIRYAALRKAFIEELNRYTQDIGQDDESYLKWLDDNLAAYKRSFKNYERELARDDLEDHMREAIEEDLATEKSHEELLKKLRRATKARMKKNSTSGQS